MQIVSILAYRQKSHVKLLQLFIDWGACCDCLDHLFRFDLGFSKDFLHFRRGTVAKFVTSRLKEPESCNPNPEGHRCTVVRSFIWRLSVWRENQLEAASCQCTLLLDVHWRLNLYPKNSRSYRHPK